MLKPAESQSAPERPVGELVHQLIEDGKAYARAEAGLAKAIASAKASALALPTALFAVAAVFALAAVTGLAVGVVIALATFLGPLLAGIVTLIIFAVVGALLAWLAVNRVKRVL